MTQDYTRWNRAGLTTLQTVDGNAATYLEDLRQALRLRFSGEPEVLQWLGEPGNDDSLAEWQQRLLEQYRAERRDYGWEMLRTLARSMHILARYQDAYSNERFLRTATQWDNLRRLVSMLDYQPAPPASAEAWVALLAKEDDAAVGEVKAGLALQHQPKDGSAPVVFETLDDLHVDYRLNRLRGSEHDRSRQKIQVPAEGEPWTFDWVEAPENLSVGEWAVVTLDNHKGIAVEVTSIEAASLTLTVRQAGHHGEHWDLADIRLQRLDQWNQAPRLNGINVIETASASHSVTAGDVLVYSHGGSWRAIRVLDVSGRRIRLDGDNGGARDFYLAQAVVAQLLEGEERFVLPLARAAAENVWDENQNRLSVQTREDDDGNRIDDYVTADKAAEVYYRPPGTARAFEVASTSVAALTFDGKPGKLASGQWLILRHQDGHSTATRITAIAEFDGYFQLSVDPPVGEGRWSQAYGRFKESLAQRGHDRNLDPVYKESSTHTSIVEMALDDSVAALMPGRRLWIESPHDAALVTLAEVERNGASDGLVRLKVTPALDGLDLKTADTWIYANVVRAGHGESKGEQVLGSGDRVQANQRFLIEKTDLAFVRDTTFDSGVKAAIDVIVDGRVWTQVDHLRNSGETDRHYAVRLTETGELIVQFGDGRHGRRLPSGSNNVRLRSRHGHGLRGNLAAHNLNKLKKPHPLVDGVVQPVNAAGGGEAENLAQVRDHAPQSVLTLKRAVSLADFGRLCESYSSVWRAKALRLPDTPGASDRIEVRVVPAGGGPLGDLAHDLWQTLNQHTHPGVQVSLACYEPLLVSVEITLRVDAEAFEPELVREAVRQALLDAFSLERANFAEPLFRSRVFEVVESVQGVKNADCVILPAFKDEAGNALEPRRRITAEDGTVRRVNPQAWQVLYLNAEVYPPTIRTEEV
ncbi:baseplate J/gp47 family protein [Halomonas urumqiensis]|uniref:Baseplate protein J-like domain-containing protein n=1 Tax=Halomonas urumqiensis TaxID=1684789 RepID=A0A2N7UCX1_9GAMM|nr:baseplate J/gp47 family protein [Halomonas urumqiensis]PMR78306.1 hypothetical protein C1H70_16230 [Halomonas urumqiensis]PTB03453.1 hypothetical protein C6V82_02865 [Halomonas urumqiensis]GHE20362.1 hypothetical protein GCM10017767_08830 [Halomonas urumqiensis]